MCYLCCRYYRRRHLGRRRVRRFRRLRVLLGSRRHRSQYQGPLTPPGTPPPLRRAVSSRAAERNTMQHHVARTQSSAQAIVLAFQRLFLEPSNFIPIGPFQDHIPTAFIGAGDARIARYILLYEKCIDCPTNIFNPMKLTNIVQ